jgi:hypothetical protein
MIINAKLIIIIFKVALNIVNVSNVKMGVIHLHHKKMMHRLRKIINKLIILIYRTNYQYN